jgi:lipid-binding SYLF domain-containing protein
MLFSTYGTTIAASKEKLDMEVVRAIKDFKQLVQGGEGLLDEAEGYLVFPKVTKAGMLIGGEKGKGVLLVDGETQGYYQTISASIGLQLGVQVRSQIIIFLNKQSLDSFKNSNGWEVGVDGSVALVNISAGTSVEGGNYNEPVIGFIFAGKGLMYNLTFEGSKISVINP